MWKHTLVAVAVVLLFTGSVAAVKEAAAESESKDVTRANVELKEAPQKDYQVHNENVNKLDDDEPVRYDGAQVWRMGFTDAHEKNAVSDLQHSFGN